MYFFKRVILYRLNISTPYHFKADNTMIVCFKFLLPIHMYNCAIVHKNHNRNRNHNHKQFLFFSQSISWAKGRCIKASVTNFFF